MGQEHGRYRGLPISYPRLCELEAEVCACASGIDINRVQFTALMERKWCKPSCWPCRSGEVTEVSEDR